MHFGGEELGGGNELKNRKSTVSFSSSLVHVLNNNSYRRLWELFSREDSTFIGKVAGKLIAHFRFVHLSNLH
jgi:hypothetical protein